MKLNRNQAIIIGSSALVAIGAVLLVPPVRSAVATHEACRSVRAYEATNGPVKTVGDGPRRVTVIGDSYAAGDVLADRSNAWVDVFAAEDDATVRVLAQGGTGFTNAGFCGDSTYAARLDRVASTRPELVIVEGGLNDTMASPAEEEHAARAVLAELRDYDVVLVGPVDVPAVDGEAEVDTALSRAAAAEGVRYVSATRWRIALGADQKHPTVQGHADFARRLADSVGR